jgi:hypothetical protein
MQLVIVAYCQQKTVGFKVPFGNKFEMPRDYFVLLVIGTDFLIVIVYIIFIEKINIQ